MSKLRRPILKSFFEAGDTPTAAQFAAFIDSGLNLLDDHALLGLKIYNPAISYNIGDTAIYNGFVYQAIAVTSVGPFNGTKWTKLTSSPLNLVGNWDADQNLPHLDSSVGNQGDFYNVVVAGDTTLDLVTHWDVFDTAVFNGQTWEKIPAATITASDVLFDNAPSGMIATDMQAATEELQLRLDTSETDIGTLQNSKTDKVPTAGLGTIAIFDGTGNLDASDKTPEDFLALDNTTVYTPTDDYNPATKKYVDDVTASDISIIPGGILGAATTVQDAVDKLENIAASDISIVPGGILGAATTVQDAVDKLENIAAADISIVPGGILGAATTVQDAVDKLENIAAADISIVPGGILGAATTVQDAVDKLENIAASDISVVGSGIIASATNLQDVADVLANIAADEINFVSGSSDLTATNVRDALDELDLEKQDALGYTAVPDTRTVNGHVLTSDVTVTKSDVGLGNADDTSDIDKPVSTAQQDALDLKVDIVAGKQLSTEDYTTAEKTKLAGIATGATANATDAQLRDRGTHTGTQTSSTISDFASSVLATVLAGLSTATNAVITTTDSILSALGKLQKQISDNLTTLTSHIGNTSNPHSVTKAQVGLGNADNTSDVNKPVSTAQAAADADILASAETFSADPANITQDATHRFVSDTQIDTWDGKEDALGFTAVPDSRTVNGHALTSNVTVTKSDVGLGNADNTSDVNKPVSTAQAAADAATLASAQTYSADPAHITQDATHRFVSDTEKSTWNGKQDALGFTAVPDSRTVNGHALTSNVTVSKSDVGLGNADNTSDVNKPVSTAQAAADAATLASAQTYSADPAHITQDSTHRFVSDTEKSTWNGKQDALGFNAVPDTRTVNGHALTSNVTVTKSDVSLGSVTDDQQLAQKFYGSFESNTPLQNATASFNGVALFTFTFSIAVVADYLIEWYYEMDTTAANGVVEGRVRIDATTQIGLHTEKLASAASYVSVHGFYMQTSFSATSHSVQVDFRRIGSSGTAECRHVRLKVTKV